jgi:hypothetical protein
MKGNLNNSALAHGLKRLLLWGPALLPILVCSFIGLSLYTATPFGQSASQMAYALMPPEYPASTLIKQWEGGGPTVAWERRTYQTADAPEQVRSFYTPHLPEFQQRERVDVTGPLYESSVCDRSEAALRLTRAIVNDHYPWYKEDKNLPVPCVTVLVYSNREDQASPGGTILEIWVEWPSD